MFFPTASLQAEPIKVQDGDIIYREATRFARCIRKKLDAEKFVSLIDTFPGGNSKNKTQFKTNIREFFFKNLFFFLVSDDSWTTCKIYTRIMSRSFSKEL